MNEYEAKKQARIERYREQSGNAAKRSQVLSDSAHKMISAIPMGQPILVGHHSEKADRNYRNRADNKMRKSFDELDKANYYARKASAAENNTAIYGDDPEAIAKLEEKLAALKSNHKELLAENKRRRKAGEPTFAWYVLPYSNRHIKETEKRIQQLKSAASLEHFEREYDGFTLIQNVEANRVQFRFDGKPADEVRGVLKSHAFRWTPSAGVWQRQLNGNGLYAAKCVIKALTKK